MDTRWNAACRGRCFGSGLEFLLAGLLFLALRASAQVVTNSTGAALRAALADGGVVTFACDGTIPLTSTIVITNSTVLDGSAHQVTIRGGNRGLTWCLFGTIKNSPATTRR